MCRDISNIMAPNNRSSSISSKIIEMGMWDIQFAGDSIYVVK